MGVFLFLSLTPYFFLGAGLLAGFLAIMRHLLPFGLGRC